MSVIHRPWKPMNDSHLLGIVLGPVLELPQVEAWLGLPLSQDIEC